MSVPLTLCDRSAEMVRAWRRYFTEDTGVRIVKQNILSLDDVNTLAVPANAFGFTDGGVDQAISKEIFDWRLQDRLRAVIERDHAGELLVGQALVLSTGSTRFPYVIVAPTMRIPGDVARTVNAYLAMRAILLASDAHNRATSDRSMRIRGLAVPGLCTGTGAMPFERAAYQIWMAYRTVVLGDKEWLQTPEKQSDHDHKMREAD